MVEWIESQPFLFAVIALSCVAGFRSQCTYWLGRGIRAGIVKADWAKRLTAEKASKATERLERWGWPIIPLSFLTVGFQTAVHLCAGILGWRWPRYTAAAALGWLAWGTIYATGGLAVFVAISTFVQQSPVLSVAVFKVLAIVAFAVLVIRFPKIRRYWQQVFSPPPEHGITR